MKPKMILSFYININYITKSLQHVQDGKLYHVYTVHYTKQSSSKHSAIELR